MSENMSKKANLQMVKKANLQMVKKTYLPMFKRASLQMFKKTEKALSEEVCSKCRRLPSRLLSRENGQSVESCMDCLNKLRNIIVSELPTRCKFGIYGCEEILMQEDIENHETRCLHYEVNCPNIYCKKKIGMLSFLEHAKTCGSGIHELFPIENGWFEAKFAVGSHHKASMGVCWLPIKMVAFDRSFFLSWMSTLHQNFEVWICLLGRQEDAKNFKAEFSFGDGNEEKIRGRTDVFPMTLDAATIVTKKLPFVCRTDNIHSLADADGGRLKFRVKIISLKAEANKNKDAESGVCDIE